jgi:L-amino acid N-acyltransferase YncA
MSANPPPSGNQRTPGETYPQNAFKEMSTIQEPQKGIILRDATADDLAAINDIYNHYVLTSTCTYQEEPETLETRGKWFRVHGPKFPVIVVEEDGEVVAWGSLSPFGRSVALHAYRFTAEDSVYVRHDMHGRGIGTMILTELLQQAQTLGYRSVIASISAEQTSSIALHEKFGFSKVAHLPEIGFKFDRWLDVVFLQKKLHD